MHEFDKCHVTAVTGERLASGFVTDYQDGVMRLNVETTGPILKPTPVFVYVYNSVKGECVYKGILSAGRTENLAVLEVEMVRSLQKRENARVNKQLRYWVGEYFTPDGTRAALEEPAEIMILNISAEGMLFNSVRDFGVGYRFPLVFREARVPIRLQVEIVRRSEYRRSYNYGCRFIGITAREQDEIYRFVLHEQIEQRRRSFLL